VIKLSETQYTKRSYFRELDEGLATHLALAYIHFQKFDYNSSLFQLFWKTQNIKRHGEFISFIGRHLISRDDPENFMTAQGIKAVEITKKFEELWDWILKNSVESEKTVFAHFGFWVGEKQALFTDLKWLAEHLRKSLDRSGGDIEWEHGVIKRLPEFAEAAPEDTLKIIDLYLTQQARPGGRYGYFTHGDSGMAALRALYKNPETKDGLVKLINKLLVLGSSHFWDLKTVIE